MKPDIRLSLFHDGKLTREPVLMTIVGLRETLLLASDFNEAQVKHIFENLEETGKCRMKSESGTELFEISNPPRLTALPLLTGAANISKSIWPAILAFCTVIAKLLLRIALVSLIASKTTISNI